MREVAPLPETRAASRARVEAQVEAAYAVIDLAFAQRGRLLQLRLSAKGNRLAEISAELNEWTRRSQVAWSQLEDLRVLRAVL